MGFLETFVGLLKTNKRVLIVGAAAMLFLALLLDVLDQDIAALDASAYVFFVLHLRRTWLTPIMQSFSGIASPVVLAVMLLLVEAFAPGRRPGICAGINLVLSVGLCLLLKQLIQRERPAESIRLVSESGYSFPSGHSMVAMAFFGFLMWMVIHYEEDRLVKGFCSFGFASVILLIGMSRIYLGVHYASDVLAGFCVTVVWLGIFTRLIAPILLGERPVFRSVGAGDLPRGAGTTGAEEVGKTGTPKLGRHALATAGTVTGTSRSEAMASTTSTGKVRGSGKHMAVQSKK